MKAVVLREVGGELALEDVPDPSGAVIPGAKITATEVDTTLSRETVSSPDGLYTINGLRPTRYNLTASAAGFRRVLQTGLVLEANDSVTINLKLEVGTASETVNVEANAVQVDTTSSTIRQVVDSARMIVEAKAERDIALANAPAGGVDEGEVEG